MSSVHVYIEQKKSSVIKTKGQWWWVSPDFHAVIATAINSFVALYDKDNNALIIMKLNFYNKSLNEINES